MLISRIYIDLAKLRETLSEFHYEALFLSPSALLRGGLILMHDLRINSPGKSRLPRKRDYAGIVERRQ